MDQIRELHHGKKYFDNFHGSNQGIAPWKNPIWQIPLTKSENRSMGKSVSQISMDQIRKMHHGKNHIVIIHGPDQEIGPWKT